MKRYIISSAAAALAMTMGTTAMAANGDSKYFKDVTVNNYGWAVEYIDYIAQNGIASGVGADMYAPGSNIERGDFAVLVNKTFTFKEAKLATYGLKDVPENSYYAQAIANCCGAGVITERGMYFPESDITRGDAIVMLYRALNSNNLVGGNISSDISMFNDGEQLSTIERKLAAGTLNKIGVINGDDKGNINPAATMTRAEMAVVFAKLDKYIDEYKVSSAQKAEEDAAKKEEEDLKKEEEKKEEAKAEESRDYSAEDVKEPIVAANGGTISVTDSTVRVSGDNGITADNKSEIDIENTNVTAIGGNAVAAQNGAVIKMKNGSATGTNGNGVYAGNDSEVTVEGTKLKADGNDSKYSAEVRGGKMSIENTSITAAENKGAVLVADGGKLNLSNVSIDAKTGVGKGTYAGAIDIISTDDNESEINLENVTITNTSGSAFYVRESDVTINVKGRNKINAPMLINSPDIRKEEQERGNNITLNLSDEATIQNTRIVLDPKTVLDINLDRNTYLGGQIDTEVKGYINITMDQDATLALDSDLYLDGFNNKASFDFANIIDNGFNIYYNENNPDNDWLEAKTYELVLGGKLIPYSKQDIVR